MSLPATRCGVCSCELPEQDDEQEEEMRVECDILWGEIPPEHRVRVCDDCWRKVMRMRGHCIPERAEDDSGGQG